LRRPEGDGGLALNLKQEFFTVVEVECSCWCGRKKERVSGGATDL
jgi:hypothetical protein